MRRRDVLRAMAGGAAATALPATTAGTRRAAAHPGPYRPYGRVSVTGAKEAVVGDDGTTVYLAATSGFAVVDVSTPGDPTVLAERRGILDDRETGPLRQIQDVKVDGDTLVVVGPANPMGEDVLRGMAVYDVAEPSAPEFVGFHETDYPVHNAFVRDGMAYLTGNDGDRNALVMVDVHGEPEEVNRWSILDADPDWEPVAPANRSLHDVWVQDGVAYVAHWDAGVWFVDVSDPTNPEAIRRFGSYGPSELADLDEGAARDESFQLPGNAHYVTVNDDATLLGVGREAWAGSEGGDGGPGGIDLWDLSGDGPPRRRGTIDPPPTPDATLGGVWTTSHNFDFAGDRLYTSWYRGGVKIFDVSDPASPAELAWWRDPGETEFWTAQKATGCFVASSRRNPGVGSGATVFAFPDHPGTQADPPSLAPGEGNGSAPGTGGTALLNGSASNATTSTPPTTTATTRSPTTATATDGTGGGETATGGQPGFGVGAALAGLGVGAWRLLGRRDS